MIDAGQNSELPEPAPADRAESGVDVLVNADFTDAASPAWAYLRTLATQTAQRAYAPYSNYHVGAAALASDGRLVTGCNVENAGLGVTLCAECGLISDLINGGGGKIVAFACVNGHGESISPCGRCRQLLFEHSAAETVLLMPEGVMTIDQVLPGGFGPRQLEEGTGTL